MAQRKSLNVNGKSVNVSIDDPDMPLLYALRDNLQLHGPRFGCGLGQCGACTVHIDGKAVRSCVTPLSAVTAQQKVVTLEGLGTPQRPHRVQKAFMLTNEYDTQGRVTRQTQADGTFYQLGYTLDAQGKVTQTDVTDPKGMSVA